MKWGLLKADVVPESLMPVAGDYSDMFDAMLTGVDSGIGLEVFELTRHQFPGSITACDAWLVSGSHHCCNDDLNWIHWLCDFIRECQNEKVKMVGICFGHQVMARALGGSVRRHPSGWGLGRRCFDIVEDRPFMQPSLKSCSLVFSHQDQVVALPPNAVVIGSDGFCRYQSLMMKDHMLTFQGHPEFPSAYCQALIESRRERLGNTAVERAVATIHQANDRDAVARWIVNFLKS